METRASIFTPVLIGSCIIIMLGFSIRASFGVFQIPIAEEFNWPRAEFSLAIAIQNLAWGIGQPIFGAIAERFGDRKAIFLGAICYALGLVLSAGAVTPIQHQLLEILVGFGIAGTGFGVILAVVGRAASTENRAGTWHHYGGRLRRPGLRRPPGRNSPVAVPLADGLYHLRRDHPCRDVRPADVAGTGQGDQGRA